MSSHRRTAAKHLAAYLGGRTEPVTLFSLACIADAAAREIGRKGDLFESLWEYPCLLPKGWRTTWLTSGEGSSSMAYAVPPGWQAGASRASSLVMDPGPLRPATLEQVAGCFN